MRDASVVFCHADREYAAELSFALFRQGLRTGTITLLPSDPLLMTVGQGLQEARRVVLIVSRHFLKLAWEEPVLDELAAQDEVIALLHGIDEEQVSPHSPRLAVAAIPGSLAGNLDRLLRHEGRNGYH